MLYISGLADMHHCDALLVQHDLRCYECMRLSHSVTGCTVVRIGVEELYVHDAIYIYERRIFICMMKELVI
jgi:hypothetical protein